MRSDTSFTKFTPDPTEVRKDTTRRTMKTSILLLAGSVLVAGLTASCSPKGMPANDAN